jgi:hypothetical protein
MGQQQHSPKMTGAMVGLAPSTPMPLLGGPPSSASDNATAHRVFPQSTARTPTASSCWARYSIPTSGPCCEG